MTRDGHTITEEEWLTSESHMLLTYFVAERMSVRKLRLADVAQCRRIEQHFVDAHSWYVLRVCEAHADGLASDADLVEARSRAEAAYQAILPHSNERLDEFIAALQLVLATDTGPRLRMNVDMIDIALFAPETPGLVSPERRAANIAEAELARDIFGNPFRPVAFDPSWRTETVVALASAIYAERAFDRLPILADALEEAGCDHPDVLSHCRGLGPHARGCWVVDGVLGKE